MPAGDSESCGPKQATAPPSAPSTFLLPPYSQRSRSEAQALRLARVAVRLARWKVPIGRRLLSKPTRDARAGRNLALPSPLVVPQALAPILTPASTSSRRSDPLATLGSRTEGARRGSERPWHARRLRKHLPLLCSPAPDIWQHPLASGKKGGSEDDKIHLWTGSSTSMQPGGCHRCGFHRRAFGSTRTHPERSAPADSSRRLPFGKGPFPLCRSERKRIIF